MYYSSRIRGQTVPLNVYYTDVCAISPDVAKSPPPTQRPQHKMAPHRRTPAASPPLSMESSSMAPNHGAEAPHESDAGAKWRGLVLATLLPLVLGAQTRPMENESGGRGLAIMWPPFVRKKRQSTERHRRRSGWFWRGDATEVGCVGRMLMHCFDSHVTRQKMKKRKYIVANATNKQAKIYDNQLKQSRLRGLGIIKETPSGRTVL